MDVPVDYRDPGTLRRQQAGRHTDVVDQAETHRPVGSGVVAGRPQGKKSHRRVT